MAVVAAVTLAGIILLEQFALLLPAIVAFCAAAWVFAWERSDGAPE